MIPGSTELVVIFIIIVLLFGASKLPELAGSLGRATSEFKKGQREAAKELEKYDMTEEEIAEENKKLPEQEEEPSENKNNTEMTDEVEDE